MSKYSCSECKVAVIVLEGEDPIKACFCEAPIVADMSAEAVATGGLSI